MLVTTQYGGLRIVDGTTLLPTPALDMSGVVCTGEEQGLLGVAVDPAFASNGFVYLYYTKDKSGNCVNRVSRFTMSGDTIDPASELVLIDEIPSPSGVHNAGDLHFGKDGFLYISVGDGGCDWRGDSGCGGANDASRDQNVLVGKILRITSTGGIPASNPFQGSDSARCNVDGRTTAAKCRETFAWGFRNPFRMAFDPNASGTSFYVNDVGQNDWEEVDFAQAGGDYGWNVREGPCVNGSQTSCGPPPSGMTNPIYAYSHQGCNAITGGAFVPNGIWPSQYDGTYLYADYVCGQIHLLTPKVTGGFNDTLFADNLGPAVNLVFGPGPALYYTTYDTNGLGQVRRIAFTGTTNRAPTAQLSASPTSGAAPLAVSLDASGSSDPDAGDTLTYTWDFGDGSPRVKTTGPTTTHTYAAGNVTATVTVADQKGASSTASAQLFPGDTPPQVTIDTPTATDLFRVGQTITLHGTATDAQDGPLPASRLTWLVVKHHSTHTHPFLAPTSGNDVPIVGPEPEDLLAATNSYLEIDLTATDSSGLSTTVTRNLMPSKVPLTFATSPSGLTVTVDGTPVTGTTTVTSWEGWNVPVSAASQGAWTFASWSDGGAAAHSIPTTASAATYTATFVQSQQRPGLVAAYGFDEGAGTSVKDASGTANNGTTNAAWTTGHTGGALSFNGSSSSVTIPDSASLDLSGGMTLEAWVKPATTSGWRTVLFKEKAGGMVYSLYASQSTGVPVGQVNMGGERNALGAAKLPLGVWSHLAATYDGSVVRLYVNGSPAGTMSVAGSIPASNGPLRIGGNSVWGEWFSGALDDVRVYNRALSQAEVQGDMQTPVGGAPPPPPPPAPPPAGGLVAAYNFDEGAGTTVKDASGNGNDGTTNAAWTTGHSGSALSFNGTSSSVTIPDSASLDLSALTLEAWVKPTSLSAWRCVLFKEQAGGMVYSLYASQASGLPVGQVNIAGERNALGAGGLPLGTWSHLAVTYDGTTLRLYVNGSPAGSLAVGGAVPASSGPLRIGGNSIWGEWFAGSIDSVRVYNRALSQAEVQADLAAG